MTARRARPEPVARIPGQAAPPRASRARGRARPRRGSRRPHSRQYSWHGSYGVPQRGSRRLRADRRWWRRLLVGEARGDAHSALQGIARRRSASSAWYIVCVVLGDFFPSPRLALCGTGVPQFAQNCASAGSGVPQSGQRRRAPRRPGRPQLAQKCEPHWIGAPHVQRTPTRRAPLGDGGSSSSSISPQALLDRDHLQALLDQEVLLELVAPVHLEHQAAEVADPLLARADERPPLAPQHARRRKTSAPGRASEDARAPSPAPPRAAGGTCRAEESRAIGRRESNDAGR